MQTLSYYERTISLAQNAAVEIIDPVEGNIHLSLEMIESGDAESNSVRYEVQNLNQAKIIIMNAQKDKHLSIGKPIIIGTYGGKYKLIAQLKLTPEDSKGSRKIRVVFFISEKGN